MDGRRDGKTGGRLSVGLRDGRTDGWTDRETNGRMDGWMDEMEECNMLRTILLKLILGFYFYNLNCVVLCTVLPYRYLN